MTENLADYEVLNRLNIDRESFVEYLRKVCFALSPQDLQRRFVVKRRHLTRAQLPLIVINCI